MEVTRRGFLRGICWAVACFFALCGQAACFKYLDQLTEEQRELYATHHFFEMSEAQFDALVLDQDKPWFLFFYAPWCLHCKKVAPYWKTFAKEIEPEFRENIYRAAVNW